MSYTGLSSISVALLLAIVALILFRLLNPISYLVDYRVSEHGIEFTFLRAFNFYNLKFTNIDYVEELSDNGCTSHPFAYNVKNRLIGKTFYIKKNRGWFVNQLLVTPENSEFFKTYLISAGVRVTGP